MCPARYYERVGLIPPVGRKGGMRNYDESDIKWVEFILCMRSAGEPIEELRTLADKLDYKIANYETEFLEKERQLLGEQQRN